MKRLFCALIIVFAPCQATAANFEQREYEMRRIVAEKQIADDQQRKQLLERIEDYAEKREVLLNRLLAALASKELRENSWSSIADDGKGLPNEYFDKGLPNSIPEPFPELYTNFNREETQFWEEFDGSAAFNFQQGIIQTGLRLEERQGELERKWRAILVNDDDIDDDNEELRKKYPMYILNCIRNFRIPLTA